LIAKEAILHIKIVLESLPRTNQYWAIRVKFLAQGNNGSLWLTGIHRLQVRCTLSIIAA